MMYSKKLLFMGVTALVASLLYVVFPREGVFQDIISLSMFLIVAPYLFVRFVLHENQSAVGLSQGHVMRGASLALGALAIMIGLFFVLQRFAASWIVYTVPQAVYDSPVIFVGYNILLVIYAFIYSYFLQGFIVNGLRAEIGIWTIPLSVGLFAIINGFSGVDAYVAIILASYIAYYSRSIYYSFIFLALVSVIINGIALISSRLAL